KITTCNSAASKISGISTEEALGKHVMEVIPNSRLDIVMNNKVAELGELFKMGKYQVLTNRVPIISKNKVTGAVATLQDITKVQEYEQRIRVELSEKGHIAKYTFFDIIGESKVLKETKKKARKYAANDSTVL